MSARSFSVRLVGGRPSLVIGDRDALDELRAELERLNSMRVWRGGEPIASVVGFVRAARAALVLIDAGTAVPAAALDSDAVVSVAASWITTEQTARLLGIGARAVRKRVVAETLVGRKVGGVLLIDSKELVADAAA